MDDSPLGKLPPELRNKIFDLILLAPDSIYVDTAGDASDLYGAPQLQPCHEVQVRDALALMATCRQIRQESIPTFYGVNKFFIDTSVLPVDAGTRLYKQWVAENANVIRGWLHSLGHSATYLRNVRIYVGRYVSIDVGRGASHGPRSPALTAWAVDRFRKVFEGTEVDVAVTLVAEWWDPLQPGFVYLDVDVCSPCGMQEQRAVIKGLQKKLRDARGTSGGATLEPALEDLDFYEDQLVQLSEALQALRNTTQ